MASEVDIVNAALAHLGDTANVATIDPPDGSMQSEYAAKMYPQARDTLLEMHDWSFATTFGSLASLTNDSTRWGYAYAKPADLIKIIGTVPAWGANSLFVETAMEEVEGFGRTAWAGLEGMNRSFAIVADTVYANQESAVFAYIKRITDTTKFSPLFVRALGWLLASDLAGVILKGQSGEKATLSALKMAMSIVGMAATTDANANSTRAMHSVSWLGR